jgi:hypothetical protein
MGLVLDVLPPAFVALDIALEVEVTPHASRRATERRMAEVFGTGPLANGTVGFFAPDAMLFGKPVYSSEIVAAAAAIDGVRWVIPRRFRRYDALLSAPPLAPEGIIRLARHEMARVDNDAAIPDRGRIVFHLAGGRT